MRIPVGNQGFEGIRLPSPARIPDAAFDSGGEQLQRAGDELMRIADRQAGVELADARQQQAEQRAAERQAEAEARQLAREQERQAEADRKQQERNAAAAALANFESDVAEAANDLGVRTRNRELDPDGANAEYARRIEAARAARLASALTPDMQSAVEDNVIRAVSRGQGVLRGVAVERAREDRVASFGSLVESLQRQALTDFEGAVRRARESFATEGVATLGADVAQQRLQKFEEDVSRTRANALVAADARVAARQLKDPTFLPALDPGQRTALLSAAEQRVLVAEQRAQIRQQAVERENERQWADVVGMVQSGMAISPAQASELSRRFRGTPREAQVLALLERAPGQVGFAAMPLRDQERVLVQMRTKGATPGQGWSLAEQEQFRALEELHERTKKAATDNPWKAGGDRGVVTDVQPLDLRDIMKIPAQIARRVEQASRLEAWLGRPVSPFTAEEAPVVQRMLESQLPALRVQFARELANAVTVPRLHRFAAQVAQSKNGDDMALAAALFLSSKPNQAAQHGARMVFEGIDVARKGLYKLSDDEFNRTSIAIRAQIRGLESTQDGEDTAVQAAMRVYMAMMASRTTDEKTARREAVRAVVNGEILEEAGGRVVVPRGVDEARLRDAKARQIPSILSRRSTMDLPGGADNLPPVSDIGRAQGYIFVGDQRLTAQELYFQRARWQLVPTGNDGEYMIGIGGRMVTRRDLRPMTIQLFEPQ